MYVRNQIIRKPKDCYWSDIQVFIFHQIIYSEPEKKYLCGKIKGKLKSFLS